MIVNSEFEKCETKQPILVCLKYSVISGWFKECHTKPQSN